MEIPVGNKIHFMYGNTIQLEMTIEEELHDYHIMVLQHKYDVYNKHNKILIEQQTKLKRQRSSRIKQMRELGSTPEMIKEIDELSTMIKRNSNKLYSYIMRLRFYHYAILLAKGKITKEKCPNMDGYYYGGIVDDQNDRLFDFKEDL